MTRDLTDTLDALLANHRDPFGTDRPAEDIDSVTAEVIAAGESWRETSPHARLRREQWATEDVTFQGRVYRRNPDHPDRHRRVYYQATSGPRTYLHRDIYVATHGPIPDGWHVHHIDHDPLNNDPVNLAAMSPQDHAAHHSQRHPDVPIVCSCGKPFVGSRPWAKWCSSACKERHRREAGVAYKRPRIGPYSEIRTCEECGVTYEARRPWARFCTPACKQRKARKDARRG